MWAINNITNLQKMNPQQQNKNIPKTIDAKTTAILPKQSILSIYDILCGTKLVMKTDWRNAETRDCSNVMESFMTIIILWPLATRIYSGIVPQIRDPATWIILWPRPQPAIATYVHNISPVTSRKWLRNMWMLLQDCCTVSPENRFDTYF